MPTPREIINNSDDHGKPTGGFLIPSDVPIEDIKAMFQFGKIEIICFDEAELDFITGANAGPVIGCLGFVPGDEVKNANTK